MIARRWTIGRLMLGVAAAAAVLAVLRLGPVAAMGVSCVLGLGAIGWLAGRGRAGLASRGFLISAAWVNLSLPAWSLLRLSPWFHNNPWPFLAPVIFVPIVPGFGLAWVGTREGRGRRARAAMVVVVLSVVPVATIRFDWPLRLAFHLASPALNRLADRAEGGGTVGPSEWAGCFRIRGATVFQPGGQILLITDPDRGGMAGFLRRPGSPVGSASRQQVDDGGPWEVFDQD